VAGKMQVPNTTEMHIPGMTLIGILG